MSILVTGANGFIGGRLIEHLENLDMECVGTSKSISKKQNFRQFNLLSNKGHLDLVSGVDCVVHCAAAVHGSTKDDNEFYQINVDATLKLARACVQSTSVKRFIFLSTIKVNGEATHGKAFTPDDVPRPADSYAKTKHLAEQCLTNLFRGTSVSLVIIRVPLVHGPGVKGNLAKLDRMLRLKVPLPIQNLSQNRRSVVSIENLVGFITLCIHHDNANNEIFFVKDGNDLNTYDIFLLMAHNNGLEIISFPFPRFIIILLLYLFLGRGAVEKLFGSLQVDCSKSYDLLGWVPNGSQKSTNP